MTRTVAVLLALLATLSTTLGFSRTFGLQRPSLRLYAEEEVAWESAFPDAEVLDIRLKEHKPLGCTVEESLGNSDLKPVFISRIVDGGFAKNAGMKVGDVIVSVTGIFGGMHQVLGKGIDELTSAVAARPNEEELDFRIVRGTQVLAQHESALVDLCASVGEDDQAIEECVVAFLTSAYAEDEDEPVPNGSCDADEDTECILDDMFDTMWGDEFAETSTPSAKKEEAKSEEEAKPKSSKPLPWRSRSSGSGTYVRDPATGEMKNIDA